MSPTGLAPSGESIGVDLDARILHGVVLAQAGHFLEFTPRGQFDRQSLTALLRLIKAKPNGELKSRVSHPGFADDGFLRFLGVFRHPRMSTAVRTDLSGVRAEVAALRADLHIAVSAGVMGDTVLQRAKDYPATFATSFVLHSEDEIILDAKGRPKLDTDGRPLPPIWRPTAIFACDVVEDGAAVSSVFGLSSRLPETPEELLEWVENEERLALHELIDRIGEDLQKCGLEVVVA